MSPLTGNEATDTDDPATDEAANARAAHSSEPPSTKTRSTEDLTIGGDSKTATGLSNAQEALRQQQAMEKTGDEAPA